MALAAALGLDARHMAHCRQTAPAADGPRPSGPRRARGRLPGAMGSVTVGRAVPGRRPSLGSDSEGTLVHDKTPKRASPRTPARSIATPVSGTLSVPHARLDSESAPSRECPRRAVTTTPRRAQAQAASHAPASPIKFPIGPRRYRAAVRRSSRQRAGPMAAPASPRSENLKNPGTRHLHTMHGRGIPWKPRAWQPSQPRPTTTSPVALMPSQRTVTRTRHNLGLRRSPD
jgi:hypothetical protein